MHTHPGRLALAVASLLAVVAAAGAQPRYTAERKGDIIYLRDAARRTIVSLIPSVGNIAFSLSVADQEVLRWPYASIEDFKAKPGLSGIPFMAPWANRLDEQAFYANGRKYSFDMELGNVRGAIPIHGFLSYTDQWEVTEVRADGAAAWATSRLDVFKQPMWMKQFPFAHTIQMTHRLEDGVLQVDTRIDNLSREPMPVSVGFHPYFRLTDSSREAWTLAVAARTHWLLAPNKIPTGQTEPIDRFFPDPRRVALKDFDLDHVFGDLARDAGGRSVVSLKGRQQQLDIVVGANYRAIVLYSPNPANGRGRAGQNPGAAPDRGFVAIEPMAGITNAMNLAHKGLYKDLQSIPPGGTWQESFWVRPSGF
jgi:aldose 1-epimerase